MQYSEQINDVIINYTLDNYIRVYTKDEAKEGYLLDTTRYSSFAKNDVLGLKIDGVPITPEYLKENVAYKEGNNILQGTYKYVYNSKNEKCYYDNNNGKFFKVINDKRLYLSDSCKAGEYKEVDIYKPYYDTSDFPSAIYQVLNGENKGIWYYIDEANQYQKLLNKYYFVRDI